MSIFNNKNLNTNIKNPCLDSFNMESFEYNLLKDLERDSFNISLEFNRTVYTGLKSDNLEIVNEGFTDFFKEAAKFFKELAMKIIEFTKNYMKYFISYFQDFKKFLEKNKEYLRSLDINFEYKGYNFDFSKDSPDLTKIHDIVSSYNSEISRVDSLTYAEVGKMRETFANEENKNKIRASILNNGEHEVSQEKFKEKSKELFRKNSEPVQLNINNSYIDMIINEYGNMKSLLEETERNKNKITKLLHDLEYFFDKKASVTYDKHQKIIKTSKLDTSDNKFKHGDSVSMNYDNDVLKTLNVYFDLKYRESKFISNCVVTVYIDKVNALKDCLSQYRNIVRRALVNNKKSSESEGKK